MKPTKEPITCFAHWPDVFLNPDAPYRPGVTDEQRRGAAIADALMAWGNCDTGNEPPKGFGKALVKLAKIIGSSEPLTPEHLHELSRAWRRAQTA